MRWSLSLQKKGAEGLVRVPEGLVSGDIEPSPAGEGLKREPLRWNVSPPAPSPA